MRYVSLFSGIEAASIAWEGLGWEPVAFSEVDAFPSVVLAERFPEAHPALVAAVEREIETGNDELAVVEVPDGIEFGIFDYDGIETVYEVGHIWG